MKNNLSPSVIFGILGAVVVLVAVGMFFGMRDKGPTREINHGAAAHQAPPPPDQPMPDWALQKLRGAENASK